MPRPRLLATLTLLCGTLCHAQALAAGPDPAALFDLGLADMEAGRFETGCPALEQSYQLDPHPGTLFTLAECEAKRGHLADAVTRYDAYLALVATLPPDKKQKQGERLKVALAQRDRLGPKVAELTLVLPPDAPAGTRVTRDGAPVASAWLGTPVVVDPGEHVASTKAPGGPVTEVRIKLGAGEKRAIALEVRETTGAPTPAAPAAQATEPSSGPNKSVLIAGGAVAGAAAIVGGALIGVSASKGSSAGSLYTSIKSTPPGGCPSFSSPQTGDCATLKSDLDAKSTLGSTGVWMLVGAGVVGAGTLVYGLVGGSRGAASGLVVTPVMTADGGGVFARGSF